MSFQVYAVNKVTVLFKKAVSLLCETVMSFQVLLQVFSFKEVTVNFNCVEIVQSTNNVSFC